MRKLYIVDAFTSEPFRGNPAGVIVTDQEISVSQMQSIAAELGFSESAFVYRQESGYAIRWFTPTVEAPLCGHATLAAAHILWSQILETKNEIQFYSLSGQLKAARKADGEIELDFPKEEMQPITDIPSVITQEFGTQVKVFGKNRLDYIAQLENEDQVRDYQPDFQVLAELGQGLIITAKADLPGIDFVSRVFAPSEGISEDPVTGSAHCCLSPYWSGILGRSRLVGQQLSRRGGLVKTVLADQRVLLSGRAVTIAQGELIYTTLDL